MPNSPSLASKGTASVALARRKAPAWGERSSGISRRGRRSWASQVARLPVTGKVSGSPASVGRYWPSSRSQRAAPSAPRVSVTVSSTRRTTSSFPRRVLNSWLKAVRVWRASYSRRKKTRSTKVWMRPRAGWKRNATSRAGKRATRKD